MYYIWRTFASCFAIMIHMVHRMRRDIYIKLLELVPLRTLEHHHHHHHHQCRQQQQQQKHKYTTINHSILYLLNY